MRLDRFLSEMGAGTRSELKKDIRKGMVTVDGITVRDPGTGVSSDSTVIYKGRLISYQQFVYYMLNKPAGVISASDDSRETTVIDLITEEKRKDLFPVGRLDRDTEGLLLITNDGDLAHRLLSPRHHVDKVYFAVIDGAVDGSDVQSFKSGLVLSDGLECMPADLTVLSVRPSETDGSYISEVSITIREGKFHQIKRMFCAVGKEVIYLKRMSMGPLLLDDSLETGSYRRLTEEEIDMLRSV